jgi:hypothetical protein
VGDMRTAVTLTGFAAVLALVFAAAWSVGSAVRAPVPVAVTSGHGGGTAHPDASHPDASHPDASHPDASHPEAGHPAAGAAADGLAATAAGYTLVPQVTTLPAGAPGEFAFSVTGSDGRPVTAYDVEHDEPLHLIVVRRDAAGYQHLHPALGPDGVWRTPLELPAGGVYRAFADFVPTGGPALTLGADLFAPGDFTPVPHAPSRVAEVDGYQVRLDGELVAGTSQVFATVTKDGAPVTDLEPHLGAFGHLVGLRQGDLAYLHVHPHAGRPAPGDRAGPGVAFTADIPTAGTYRLFLDFRHGGTVRTAEFTVSTAEVVR